MRKRTCNSGSGNNRLMSTVEGCTYTGIGRSSFLEWSSEIGATVHIGRRCLHDRNRIDEAINALTKSLN